MNRDEIMDRVGAYTWDGIKGTWGGATLEGIKYELDAMFPTDDNEALAKAIYDELQKD